MRKLLAVPFAALLLTSAAHADSPPAGKAPVEMKPSGKPGTATAKKTTRETATIKAVDLATRSLTLETGKETQTIKVSPAVTRLEEFAVGDKVVLDVEIGLALEFQEPGAADVPGSVIVTAEKTGKGEAPEVTSSTTLHATVTITALDKKKRFVTFEGPGGNSYKVKAGPKIKFEKLKVGDKLVGTYIEATAMRLEKAKAKGGKKK